MRSFRDGIDDIHARMGGQLAVAVFDKTATNPAARIGEAIAAFGRQAPEVELQLHVGPINAIERGVIDGSYQVGIIPAHRSSQSLVYTDLFGETMLLYCGAGHPLFGADHAGLDWDAVRAYPFAGLGYHSPNMELSHRARFARAATGFDQESIATLILSGAVPGVFARPLRGGFRAAGTYAGGAAGTAALRVPVRGPGAQVAGAVAGGAGVRGVPGAGAWVRCACGSGSRLQRQSS